MKTALVVIDMQDDFDTAHHESTVRNVIKAIKFAKSVELPIIVLEYESMGRTLYRIRKHLIGYDKVIYKTKDEDDGGYEVMSALRKNGFTDVHSLAVCGININACVSSTIESLVHSYDKTIKVIKSACWGHTPNRKHCFSKSHIYQDEDVELLNLSQFCQPT